MQITFDITASVDQYDIAALTADDAADAVFLMAYDYIGNSASHAASHSPLDEPVTGFDIRNTVADLHAVADPAHTILGLPWYGRAWTTKTAEAGSPTRSARNLTGPGFSWYDDAIAIARDNGRNYDPVAQTAWTVYVRKACDTCPEAWRQVWYDDVDGFGAKARFALEQGMRGVGMWALGYTGGLPGMWTVIDLTIGDRDGHPRTERRGQRADRPARQAGRRPRGGWSGHGRPPRDRRTGRQRHRIRAPVQ